MRALWGEEHPTYAGKHVEFSGVNAFPRPVSPTGPDIVVGGTSQAALRRTVTKDRDGTGSR